MTHPAPRASNVSIPPLRSMTIRHKPHHNSAANLQAQSSADTTDLQQAIEPHRTASSIPHTIQSLESLLHEALKIAHLAAEGESEQIAASQGWGRNGRRPSKGIQARASAFVKHLEQKEELALTNRGPKAALPVALLSTENQGRDTEYRKHDHTEDVLQACAAAREDISKIKASLVEPKITITDADWQLRHLHAREQSLPSLAENSEPTEPVLATVALKEPQCILSRRIRGHADLASKRDIKKYIKIHDTPPVTARTTSKMSASRKVDFVEEKDPRQSIEESTVAKNKDDSQYRPGDIDRGLRPYEPGHEGHFSKIFGVASKQPSIDLGHLSRSKTRKVDLKGCRHVDIHQSLEEFDLHETCNHRPIARDWPNSRKRFTAAIACINTACIGIIIGIYAGEVPAIQYVIVDFHHYTILGNVFLYIGLVIPTLFLWPLPLLHGRKPYTVAALSLALCLQIPQGIAVGAFRSPYVGTYRVLLLLSRAASGFALGFANINLHSTLLDLFGASLQSGNPHQEMMDEYDVRRHGGGMGLWLAIWSWCTIGSISTGFLIGAILISAANVTWGFWTCLLLLMMVLLLNVIAPELRRSAFRRTLAEVRGDNGNFNRVARGEIKMHLKAAGPYWWGEEVKAGMEMCWLMLKQPGFLILAVYTAWVYAQFTMILMLLGALASTYYNLRPEFVGFCAISLGIGAVLATPFQKASVFSRARVHPPRTDSMTLQKTFVWSSHLARRSTFTVLLPLSAVAYTLTSMGPPMPLAVPCLFASTVGFLSNLAIAECYGLIMETFDTSDLQPGMTGRPARKSVVERLRHQRTNFSCYPRVSSGIAITQSLEFIFGAVATGICGRVERRLGTLRATAIVAGTLLGLTILLTAALWRYKTVKMIPSISTPAEQLRRQGTAWDPVILGKPSGRNRQISMLEAGRQSRWSEIRRRNRVNSGMA